jgi:class 3 adenylate cyclase/tetratricopeptide (TPR) repeat protein
MPDEVGRWLEELGLGGYAEAFAEHKIDFRVLPELNSQDLREMNIPLGPRKLLLKAIAELQGDGGTTIGTEETATRETASQGRPATEAERRQLSVMFVDLVGSTELSARLDPEDLREVMRRYQDAVAGAVTRYAGHVAKYLGDGVLAYFGWPQAHEDQAERAVRAGLDAVAAVSRLKLDGGVELQARTGIATGQVVIGDLVGEMGREADAVSGETPNLAARLQGGSEPGQVTVGEATRRLIGNAFELEDLGAREFKGFPEPIPAWRVVGERALGSRFEATHSDCLTNFVGREQELGLLLNRWEQAKQGEGQVVLLSGEAGIGKSRISRALRERAAKDPYTRLQYQCSPYHDSTALYPFISQLERAAALALNDTAEAKLGKLEALLSQATEAVDEVVPLFASLLSVAAGDRYPRLEMTPQQQKQRTLEALVDQLQGLAAHQPVLLIFEDAHWVDPTSLEVLEQILDRVQGARVLVVITYRPEFSPPWRGYTHITSLALNRLGQEQCATIVGYVTGNKALPDEVLSQILAKTDGFPLFVEELTKTVLESGLLEDAGSRYALAGPLSSLAIPSTLQDSLMARLDRLGPVKEVAQLGAAIGRVFSYRLLAAVSPLSDAELHNALGQLVESELVHRRGAGVESTYVFKHALVRDVAYGTFLKSQRQRLHARIAEVLEEHFTHVAANQPELVAHHLSESGQFAKSIDFWVKAARKALSRAAYREASSFVDHGLTALQAQDRSPKTMAAAVDMRLLKYSAQYPLGKPQSLLAILSEAEHIAAGLNDAVRMCKVLSTQTYALASDGQVDAAIVAGQRNIKIISEKDDVNNFCNGKLMLGRALYAAGRYTEVIHHAKDVMDVVGENVELGKRSAALLSHTINARAWLVLTHAEKGEFKQGIRLGGEGLQLLENVQAAKHDRLWMENAIGRLNVVKGNFAMAIEGLEPVWPFCESNFPVYIPRVASSLGAAYAASGNVDKGLELLRQADAQSNFSGFQFGHALVLSLLAEALFMAGKETEARDKATRAIEIARNAGERGNEGWAACVLGDITAQCIQRDDAKAHYNQGLEIAEALSMAPLRARCLRGLKR